MTQSRIVQPRYIVDGEGDPYSSSNPLPVQGANVSAFGEQLIAEPTPIFQADFSYNINADIWHDHSNNGTASVVGHQLNLSTGAAANQSAEIMSRAAIKYHPGQGGLIRFTGVFTTGVANSTQLIGLGSSGDGYFFGYNGADFGILRRQGGHQEIRTLTITTKSTTAENITITLDGDADATVAVTDATATDLTTTANEIAAHDYTNLGRGWEAHSPGDGTVIFLSLDSASHPGTYSLSGASTAVGTFAQDIAGAASTDTWTAQTSWSKDKLSGSGSAFTLDPTKGNVFQIRYQWLGYGAINFYVENPETGDWVEVHRIEYANANIVPSINNPSLPILYLVENTTNTSDIVLKSGSCAGFTEGKTNGGHLHHGTVVSRTGISGEKPVAIIHNPLLFAGVPNRVRLKVIAVSASVEGTKPALFRFRRDAVIETATYTDVEAGVSVIEEDVTGAATSITGGDVIFPSGLAKTAGETRDLSTSSFYINPGETLAGTIEPASGTTDAVVSIDWEELF